MLQGAAAILRWWARPPQDIMIKCLQFLWFCPLSWLKFCHVYAATQNKWNHSLLFKLRFADIILFVTFRPLLIDNIFFPSSLAHWRRTQYSLPPSFDASFIATFSIPGQEVRASLEITETQNNRIIFYIPSLGSASLPILLFTCISVLLMV